MGAIRPQSPSARRLDSTTCRAAPIASPSPASPRPKPLLGHGAIGLLDACDCAVTRADQKPARPRRRRFVPTLLLLLASITHAYGACRIERRTQVPLLVVNNLPLVELKVNGKDATFVLDTGTERTLFADTAVRELGLARDEWVSSSVRGVG